MLHALRLQTVEGTEGVVDKRSPLPFGNEGELRAERQHANLLHARCCQLLPDSFAHTALTLQIRETPHQCAHNRRRITGTRELARHSRKRDDEGLFRLLLQTLRCSLHNCATELGAPDAHESAEEPHAVDPDPF